AAKVFPFVLLEDAVLVVVVLVHQALSVLPHLVVGVARRRGRGRSRRAGGGRAEREQRFAEPWHTRRVGWRAKARHEDDLLGFFLFLLFLLFLFRFAAGGMVLFAAGRGAAR